MATGARNDPYRGYNFVVELDGIDDAVAGFREVTGLVSNNNPIEYRDGSDPGMHVRKLTNLTTYANIVAKRGITQHAELFAWYRNAVNGVADRRNGAIVLRDDQNQQPVLRWEFREAWICKWEGPSLNATTSEVALETIEIAVEVVELVA